MSGPCTSRHFHFWEVLYSELVLLDAFSADKFHNFNLPPPVIISLHIYYLYFTFCLFFHILNMVMEIIMKKGYI